MSSFEFKNDNVKIISLPGSPAQDGSDATGVTQPTGGAGIRGWLSGIYNLLFSGSAKVQLTGSNVEENNLLKTSGSRRMVEVVSPLKTLNIPTYVPNSNEVVHPTILYFNDGWNGYIYWMAITPYTNFDSQYENPSILVSNDGENWIEPAGVVNPIFGPPTTGFYADPRLVYVNTTEEIWLYWVWNNLPSVTLLSKSSDGVNWTTPIQLPNHIQDAAVVRTGSTWYAFTQQNAIYGTLSMYASTDGVNFDTTTGFKIQTNLAGHGHHLNINRMSSGLHLTYHMRNLDGEDVDRGIYYGYSKYGYGWVFDPIPILSGRDFSSQVTLYTPALVQSLEHDIYNLYVSYVDEQGLWQLGLLKVKLKLPVDIGSPQSLVIPLLSGYELRTTDTIYPNVMLDSSFGRVPEWNDYPNRVLYVFNSLGKSVTITLNQQFGISGINRPLIDGNEVSANETIVDSNAFRMTVITKNTMIGLGLPVAGYNSLSFKTAEAPIAGKLTACLVLNK